MENIYIDLQQLKTYQSSNPRSNLEIAIGPNGCGKSFWLKEKALNSSQNVIAISTTFEDKFKHIKKRHISVLSPRSKLYALSTLFGKFIKRLSKGDGKFRFELSSLLEYIKYDPCIYVKIDGIGAFISNNNRVGFNDFENQTFEDIISLTNSFRDNYIELDLHSYESEEKSRAISNLLTFLSKAKESRVIDRFEIALSKGKVKIPINYCSSGEMQLVRILGYLLLNISEGSCVLIDEPENSFHPKWQSEFIERLLAITDKYNPVIKIATHSPMILSGLFIENNDNSSIEKLLYDSFSIITPKNNYLAELISNKIDEFTKNPESKIEIVKDIMSLSDIAIDKEQKSLISNISEGVERAY